MAKKISIVIPCYNEAEALPIIYEALSQIAAEMNEYAFEFVLVNDGSVDATLMVMKELAAKDARVFYYSFSRNFGKEAALLCGLKNASGDFVVTMDADMQDPPELLPQMAKLMESGEFDNIATRRVSRKGEPPIRSFFARRFYKMMRRLTKIEIADGARDYRMMSKAMVESILALPEYNRFSKGIFAWVGYRTKWLEFENKKRSAGETKWSFFALMRYSVDGLVNFSNAPIRISSVLGIVMTILSFIAIIFEVIRALIFGDPVAGWPSLVCIITFIGGIQLFCMGIMGQYISKTYMEVKHRPHFIVGETNDNECEKNG